MTLHGPVEEYVMPLEEFYERYGFYPPKHPDLEDKHKSKVKQLKERQPSKNWNWSKLTKARYMELRRIGKTDADIIHDFDWIDYENLKGLKKKWKVK